MFDALLGRGFAGKCKSSVVKLKSRLLMVKSKKKAVVGYLKKDIAELIRAGRDKNAFDRVEGYMVELYRATCYDLIDEFCDCLCKNLSTMQKQAECPDQVKEAVSSLMYAAARISELPELCSLRNLFSEKYGSSLDSFVNKEFVEKITSKPPSMDKKLLIMQDVCKELSVKWDLKACQLKISTPTAIPYIEAPKARPLNNVEDDALKEVKKNSPRDKDVFPTAGSHSPRKDIKQIEKVISDEKAYPSRRRDLRSDHPYEKEIKQEQLTSQQILNQSKDGAGKREKISPKESELPSRSRYTPRKENNMGRRDVLVEQEIPRSQTPVESSDLRYTKIEQTISIKKIYHYGDADDYNHRKPILGQTKGTENPLPNRVIPPPYVKPNKIANNRGVVQVVADRNVPIVIPKEGSDITTLKDSHRINHGRSVNRYDRDEKDHHEEIKIKEILVKEIKPKPISVRRKPVLSSPVDEVVDKYPVAAQSLPAEKIDRVGKIAYPKTSLEDEEEEEMDKLLIHYSKKTLGEDGLTGLKGRRAPLSLSNAETNHKPARVVERIHSPPSHAPQRISSLPTEHTPEVVKLTTRAASFGSDKRPHVHPKLPDYDDLAARFAALKAK